MTVNIETRVLIIGGGVTGTGLARDLSMRGVECMLLEKRDLAVGASGGNHGLLHSGARYVASDPAAAQECRAEGAILKKIAPHLIENTGGLFVAVAGDNEQYIADFPALCEKSAIPYARLSPKEARELEPAVSPRCIAAYTVQDAAIDPFMLCLDNMAQACSLGARLRCNARVTDFQRERGRIQRAVVLDETTGRSFNVEAELVVNTAGAWAGIVAAMAGAAITVRYSSGSLIVTQDRIAQRVINRLRHAADADILVPGGTVSILGTTSERVDDPDLARPSVAEVNRIVNEGARMIPVLASTRYIRAYAGVRPLVCANKDGTSGSSDDRSISRGFTLLDHAPQGVENCITITGGKLTTYRLMAEKAADMACRKLGINVPCRTHMERLPGSVNGRWTEPGRSARFWVDKIQPEDIVLCECEMVSARVVDEIADNLNGMTGAPLLSAVGQRSRVGKGPCQGGFCGPRITAHFYDRGVLQDNTGLHELTHFIERRWRGKRPVLWGHTLMQAELQEAVHCNILDLELQQEEKAR